MKIDLKQDCTEVDWKTVSETLKCVEMAYHEPDMHRKAFEASHGALHQRGGNERTWLHRINSWKFVGDTYWQGTSNSPDSNDAPLGPDCSTVHS